MGVLEDLEKDCRVPNDSTTNSFVSKKKKVKFNAFRIYERTKSNKKSMNCMKMYEELNDVVYAFE